MIGICGTCFKKNLDNTKGFIEAFEEKIASEFLGKVSVDDFLSKKVKDKFCKKHYTREYLFEKFINLKNKYANKSNNQDSSNQVSFNNTYERSAKAYGKQHKEKKTNFFEILELDKNLQTKVLINKCKTIMIKNHTDRNPKGKEKYTEAGNLKEMLENDTLKFYEQALKN